MWRAVLALGGGEGADRQDLVVARPVMREFGIEKTKLAYNSHLTTPKHDEL